MNILKQSTAATIKLGPFIDDTDGKTAETGLTISQADIRLSKNGGDFAQTNNSAGATHDEFGYYDIPLDATDTGTLGRLRVAVSESGALPVWQEFLVVTANVYDTLCSTDNLDVNVTSLADDVITAGKFDESTAFPLKSADTGSTAVARTGADSDTLETLSDEIAAVKAETALIVADTGTDGVKLASTQGAILWGQQKIVADVDGQGALTIQNTHDNGFGKLTFGGLVGEYNYGLAMAGVRNQSDEGIGTLNDGYTFGVRNAGISGGMYNKATGVGSAAMFNDAQGTDGIGLKNVGEAQNVEGFDPAIATATKLQTVDDIVDTIKTKTDNLPATPASAGEYTAAIAAIPTAPLLAANYTAPDNASIATIKAKTNLIPANPAVADEYDAALAAIQADLDNPNQYKADVSGIPAAVWGYATRTLSSFGSLIADIWSHVTRTLSSFGFTVATNSDANVTAIKAKTDNLPATPASAGEYTSALTAIQNDLDNPDQYKADVSGLATTTDMSDLKDRIDAVDTIADAILEDTGTTIPATLATIAGYTDGIAGDVWSYAKRTLTHPSVSAEEPEDSNTLILYRDADIAIELTDLTIPVGAKKYIFTIKDNLDGGDDQAVLQASYAIDGSEVETNTLVYINSAVPPALTNPVTFTLTETNITIDLTAEAAALLPRYERGYLNWDLKLVTDAAVTIVLQGLAQIIGTSTRAIE